MRVVGFCIRCSAFTTGFGRAEGAAISNHCKWYVTCKERVADEHLNEGAVLEEIKLEQVLFVSSFVFQTVEGVILWNRYRSSPLQKNQTQPRPERETS